MRWPGAPCCLPRASLRPTIPSRVAAAHPASDAKRVKLEHGPKEEEAAGLEQAAHKAESDGAAGAAAAADLQDDFAWEDM